VAAPLNIVKRLIEISRSLTKVLVAIAVDDDDVLMTVPAACRNATRRLERTAFAAFAQSSALGGAVG
jgi:hypothetical protein